MEATYPHLNISSTSLLLLHLNRSVLYPKWCRVSQFFSYLSLVVIRVFCSWCAFFGVRFIVFAFILRLITSILGSNVKDSISIWSIHHIFSSHLVLVLILPLNLTIYIHSSLVHSFSFIELSLMSQKKTHIDTFSISSCFCFWFRLALNLLFSSWKVVFCLHWYSITSTSDHVSLSMSDWVVYVSFLHTADGTFLLPFIARLSVAPNSK